MIKKRTSKKVVKKVAPDKNVVATSSVSSKKAGIMKYVKYVLLFLVVAGVLYYFRSLFVVAIVNGKPISRISVVKELEARNGKQIIDEMITVRVIEDEAKKQGITVTNLEIDAEQEKVNTMLVAQGTSLEQALSNSGQSLDSVRRSFRTQKLVEKLLGDKVSVTDDEAKEYFESYKDSFGEGVVYEDVQAELKDQLKQQKMGTEFEKWITEKKESSRVIFLMDF